MKRLDEEKKRKLREFEEIDRTLPPGVRQRMKEMLNAPISAADRRIIEEFKRPEAAIEQLIRSQFGRVSDLNRLTASNKKAIEAIGQAALGESRRISERMKDVALSIAPTIRQQMDGIARLAMTSLDKDYRNAINDTFSGIAKMAQQAQRNVSHDLLLRVSGLAPAPDASWRLALETLRGMNLDIMTPPVSEFIEDALGDERPLTKERVEALEETHLSKKKLLDFTPQQQWRITTAISILALLVAFYSVWQGGRPIIIDSSKVPQNVTITHIWQMVEPATPVRYEVRQECKLRDEPNNKSAVILILSPEAVVERIDIEGNWFFVKNEDDEVGWASRRYLKRVK